MRHSDESRQRIVAEVLLPNNLRLDRFSFRGRTKVDTQWKLFCGPVLEPCISIGKLSAYVVDVDSFEFMQNKLRVLEGIVRGERAVLEGRTYSEEEAKQKMNKWLD